MDLIHLTDIAIKAALDAGQHIKKYLDEEIAFEEKEGGESYASQVVTAIDKECENIILSHLLPKCEEFNIALLTEETEDDGSRFEKDYFWCIDPIDGTLNFINKEPGFSVSIALIAKYGTPCIGVVYDPVTDTLYHATKGNGVFKNRSSWQIKNSNDYLTYVTDKKLKDTPRLPELKALIQKYVDDLELKEFKVMSGGASVMNGIRVLENGPACMIKYPKKETGGGSIWDFAATACIFHELGFPATNFEGERLDLNKKEGTFMNHEGIFYANFSGS
ncbi:MAG: inositol monophosphatase [Balneola sp.]|jgi:fructose-1,6-bisphosphatase/inositol monophosphatase family enzyme|nr:inositol monophosphatase [Balneola sp.]MBE79282.1 inositol monophosphatase [Balneola sp.]|tara:strand:- start:404 stop:1231 length:828 start_codon:yes stop_codon:yes gene_type:complete